MGEYALRSEREILNSKAFFLARIREMIWMITLKLPEMNVYRIGEPLE